MNVMKRAFGVVAMGLAVAWVAGGASSLAAQPKTQKGAHAHAHPSEGPHHGSLIELGRESQRYQWCHGNRCNRT